jgi:hypothetical protein
MNDIYFVTLVQISSSKTRETNVAVLIGSSAALRTGSTVL